MGPSGSGKSTLLALICTIEKATDGKIILDGTDLTLVPEKLLPHVRREKIGFIFSITTSSRPFLRLKMWNFPCAFP